VDFSLEHECLPDGIAIIAVRGELNQYTSAKYRDLMIQLFKDGNRRLVVDLELCEFLDSTGISTFAFLGWRGLLDE
jgi:anti-anti-sigma factor